MKILITGADGFVGSHLTEFLIKKNYDIKAFVLYNSFGSWGWLDKIRSDLKKNLDVYMGDIRDSHAVNEAFKGCDVVIHLASLISIPYSYKSPDSYIDSNIKGTLNILQACLKNNVNKIIHTSTSEVYGTAIKVPINETHPLQGQSPYSASKIAADQLVYSFFSSFDLQAVTIRPFNIYGPRQSTRAIIPTIITQLMQDKVLKLGSLTPTRDFNYIQDILEAYEKVLISNKGYGEVFNIGSNFEISIGETIDLISNIIGKKVKIQKDEKRIRPVKSEVNRLWADNTKAKKYFSWTPKYAGKQGFIKGLNKTISWYKQILKKG